MKNKKGQQAMEFLMTYGWAIIVVLGAIGALAYFGVLSPENLIPCIAESDRCGCIIWECSYPDPFPYWGNSSIKTFNTKDFELDDCPNLSPELCNEDKSECLRTELVNKTCHAFEFIRKSDIKEAEKLSEVEPK